MLRFHWLSIAVFLFFQYCLTGCIESFDYKSTDVDTVLVVDGGITNSREIQTINLSYTTKYGTLRFYPVRGANMELFENGVNVDADFMQIAPGRFQFDGNLVNAAPGKEYYITIILPNGKTYKSTPEIMPDPVTPDSAYFKVNLIRKPVEGGYSTERKVLDVYINTPVRIEDRPAFLRWRVYEYYSLTELKICDWCVPRTCYMSIEPDYQEVTIFSGSEVTGGILEDQVVLSREKMPDVEFRERHYFNISQYSITRAAYEYWTRLKIVANPTGSFIDIPPAAVIGNIYNINDKKEAVLGYFEVASEEIIRTFSVPPMLVPHYTYDPCREFRPFCFDCLTLPNSTYDRPEYW